MARELNDLARRWLHSERDEDEARAQRALALLLQALPAPRPAAGFAGRVLAAVRAQPAPSWATPVEWFLARPAVRAVLVACLAASCMALSTFPGTVWALLRTVDLARILDLVVETATAVAALFDFGLQVWRVLADVGRALGLALSVPELVVPMLGAGLLALFALRVLLHTASLHWSPVHVDTART